MSVPRKSKRTYGANLHYDCLVDRKKWLWYALAVAMLAATFAAYGQFGLLFNWVYARLC